jgi:hypothetical protein
MQNRYSLLAIAAGIAMLVRVASATPVGTVSITNTQNGGVSVSATRIDWFPPSNSSGPPGVGDFATGSPTNITYDAGVLTAASNPYGQIKDIDAGSGIITNFIQFYVSSLLPSPPGTGALLAYPVFDLIGLTPGGSNQGALDNCAGVTAIGVACSPLVNIGRATFISPFVLTFRGFYTDVSLGVNLIGRDATGSAPWAGGFTTQVIAQNGVLLTPDAIQTIINSGGVITNTYSGTFTASEVPEPATFGLLGIGMLAVRRVGRRRG